MKFYRTLIALTAFSVLTVTFADNNDIWKCSESSCTICAISFPVCIRIKIDDFIPSITFTMYEQNIGKFEIDSESVPLCFPFTPVPLATMCIVGSSEELAKNQTKICTAVQVRLGQTVIFQFQLACFKLDNGELSVLISHLEF